MNCVFSVLPLEQRLHGSRKNALRGIEFIKQTVVKCLISIRKIQKIIGAICSDDV